jgi:hypothetical protein
MAYAVEPLTASQLSRAPVEIETPVRPVGAPGSDDCGGDEGIATTADGVVA